MVGWSGYEAWQEEKKEEPEPTEEILSNPCRATWQFKWRNLSIHPFRCLFHQDNKPFLVPLEQLLSTDLWWGTEGAGAIHLVPKGRVEHGRVLVHSPAARRLKASPCGTRLVLSWNCLTFVWHIPTAMHLSTLETLRSFRSLPWGHCWRAENKAFCFSGTPGQRSPRTVASYSTTRLRAHSSLNLQDLFLENEKREEDEEKDPTGSTGPLTSDLLPLITAQFCSDRLTLPTYWSAPKQGRPKPTLLGNDALIPYTHTHRNLYFAEWCIA